MGIWHFEFDEFPHALRLVPFANYAGHADGLMPYAVFHEPANEIYGYEFMNFI